MTETNDPNREALIRIAGALEGLRKDVVFVGGAVVGLLITDSAAPPVRVTKDVDCIIEVASRSDYFGRVRDRLLERGFREMRGDDIPVCAWEYAGLRLDVMPTEESVLGFSNSWYHQAIRYAADIDLGTVEIRVITPPYFIATKMAAFQSRGGGDFYASHDIEDLIAVIDGRPTICLEVAEAKQDIRQHVSEIATKLLASEAFISALPGHVVDRGRERVILQRLREIAAADRAHPPSG